jgi:hypothetical protein
VSSDPYADLARSLTRFTDRFREQLDTVRDARPGSPAIPASEPYAGDWSEHPSRDVVGSVLLEAWSALDHLTAAAVLIPDRRCLASLYSVTRGAAEHAAMGCYLAEPGISPLERIRRNLNFNLTALFEDTKMIGTFSIEGAGQRVARHETKTEEIVRTGAVHNLPYTKPTPYRAGYLSDRPPGAMALIDLCASATAGLGVTYHRLLSSVSHGQLHGLSRFLMRVPGDAPAGLELAQLNTDARTLALHLLAGPLCAVTLTQRLGWFLGWETGDIETAVRFMLHAWGRIGQVEYALNV